jgi:hypothetical protein
MGAVLLGANAIGVGCSGNGGGDSRLSLEQYFQQVQAIWDDYDEQEAAVSRQFPSSMGEPEATQKGFSAVTAIFREALAKQDDLEPPAEAQKAHQQFLAAGRGALEASEDIADRLAETESWSELVELMGGLQEDPEIVAAQDRFTDACYVLERIARDNDIDVDLDCEDD